MKPKTSTTVPLTCYVAETVKAACVKRAKAADKTVSKWLAALVAREVGRG